MDALSNRLPEDELPTLPALELWRVCRKPEAERLGGMSWDAFKKNHPDKVLRLGKRAEGTRVGWVLQARRMPLKP